MPVACLFVNPSDWLAVLVIFYAILFFLVLALLVARAARARLGAVVILARLGVFPSRCRSACV
jgi:hypothetical protein